MFLSFCPDVFVFVILACQEVCLQISYLCSTSKWNASCFFCDSWGLNTWMTSIWVWSSSIWSYLGCWSIREPILRGGAGEMGNVNWGMPETHTGASDVRCARSEYETGHCFWDFCVWFQVSSDWDVVKVCQKLKCRLLFESTLFLSQMHLQSNAAKWGLWIMNVYELQDIFGTG